MPEADEEIVTFRLPRRDRAAIQRLVDGGAFQNRSDFLRTAIRLALRENGIAPTSRGLDLELESVDLPMHDAARPRARGSHHKRGQNR